MGSLRPQSRRDYAYLVVVGALLYMILIVMVSAVLPRALLLFYSAVLTPAIFVVTAFWLARRTCLGDWLTFWSPQLSLGVALKYVGLVAAISLAARALVMFLAPHVYPQFLAGSKLVMFRWPPLSLPLFRSVVGSPVGEEILFRGWMMSWLREKDLAPYHLGKHPIDATNLLTSLTFALLHILNSSPVAVRVTNMVAVFFISLLLGKARNRSGGILLPMVLHAVINFISQSVVVPVSS